MLTKEQLVLDYFKGNQIAADVWKEKYALRDLNDKRLERTPDDTHMRLAEEFAKISARYMWNRSLKGLSEYGENRSFFDEETVYKLLYQFKDIIAQGSPMAMIGNNYQIGSTSNCVVVKDVVDSYGGIMYTDQQLVQLMKRRCGVGVDISKLRPKDSSTNNAAKSSTGAVSFARRFSRTTNEVSQKGRRGALMITLDCRHPDILEFIQSKSDNISITGANISVKWHDDFLQAAKNDEDYCLRWPVDADVKDAKVKRVVSARYILEQAAMYAHGYDQDEQKNSTTFGGDPGCMFIDRMIDYSTDCGYPDITVLTTNPCGEIGMDNDSCRLMILNLISCVENPFQSNAFINFDKVERLAYELQVLLDNLIDIEIDKIIGILNKVDSDPEDERYKDVEKRTWLDLLESAQLYRRTGGGFTGLADMLAAVNVKYGSQRGNDITRQVMKSKVRGEWNASIDLAIQRGPFPCWNREHDTSGFFVMLQNEFPDIYNRNMEYGRRNISLSTVAPTGSVSLLANINGKHGVSSGIEPVFSTQKNKFWYIRNKRADQSDDYDYVDDEGNKWKQYPVFHEGFRQWLINDDTIQEMAQEKDCHVLDVIESLDEGRLKVFAQSSPYVTSAGLDPTERLDLQALVQKYTTHSISSTLNLPQDSHWKTTLNIYKYAWQKGLKGVTVFRNGCKNGVLGDGRENKKGIIHNDAPSRPDELDAHLHYINRGNCDYIIAIGLLEEDPYEIFILQSYNEDVKSYWQKLMSDTRPASIRKFGSGEYSLKLSDEVVIDNILKYSPSGDVDVLTRMASMLMRHGAKIDFISDQIRKADITVNHISLIIGNVLKKYVTGSHSSCPQCDSEDTLQQTEGCLKCINCGYSRC